MAKENDRSTGRAIEPKRHSRRSPERGRDGNGSSRNHRSRSYSPEPERKTQIYKTSRRSRSRDRRRNRYSDEQRSRSRSLPKYHRGEQSRYSDEERSRSRSPIKYHRNVRYRSRSHESESGGPRKQDRRNRKEEPDGTHTGRKDDRDRSFERDGTPESTHPRQLLEASMVIRWRDSGRVVSKGSVVLTPLPSSPRLTFDTLHTTEGENLRRLSLFLSGSPLLWQPVEGPDEYLGPVVVLHLRFYHKESNDFCFKTAQAWAFGRQYLFTSKHCLHYEKHELVGVYVVDPRKPYIRTTLQLRVFFEAGRMDVAILQSPTKKFHRLEMHPTSLQAFGTVYHVDYIDRDLPVLHRGNCFTQSSDLIWDWYGRSNARNFLGFSGGPVVLPKGWCIGMHIGGGDIDSRFITIEGLIFALGECHGKHPEAKNWAFWGAKFVGGKANSQGPDTEEEARDVWTPRQRPRSHNWLKGIPILEEVDEAKDQGKSERSHGTLIKRSLP